MCLSQIAEDTGIIKDLGLWVLEAAIEQMLDWQRREIPIPGVAINLSGKQLETRSVIKDFFASIEKSSIDPRLLEFELTESVLMGYTSSESTKCLESLHSHGHRISIDDFGTGYSSLSYLRYLPVNALKMDRSFVDSLLNGEQEKTLVLAILAIAKSMKLKVVAESIETEEQKAFLIENGCDEGQGYLFSKPLSAGELEEYVLRHARQVPGHKASRRRRPVDRGGVSKTPA